MLQNSLCIIIFISIRLVYIDEDLSGFNVGVKRIPSESTPVGSGMPWIFFEKSFVRGYWGYLVIGSAVFRCVELAVGSVGYLFVS